MNAAAQPRALGQAHDLVKPTFVFEGIGRDGGGVAAHTPRITGKLPLSIAANRQSGGEYARNVHKRPAKSGNRYSSLSRRSRRRRRSMVGWGHTVVTGAFRISSISRVAQSVFLSPFRSGCARLAVRSQSFGFSLALGAAGAGVGGGVAGAEAGAGARGMSLTS